MENNEHKKILLIQLRRMGDVILTTPVITLLRETFKDAQIDFLVEKEYSEVLEGYPDLNNILTYNDKSVLSMLGVIKKVRANKYDIVFDFFGNPRSAWITLFSGAKERVGFNYRVRQMVYTKVVVPPPGLLYVPEHRTLLLKAMGIDGELIRPYIFIPKTAREYALNFYREKKVSETEPLIGLVVPNTRPSAVIKNWTREGFSELARLIIKTFGARIILFAGPGEEKERDMLYVMIGGRAMIHPPVGIKQLSALVKRCHLVVTNCGGTRHVAVATGTPTLTIYGPTHHESWTPPEDEEHQVISKPLSCLGCNKEACESMECMKTLTAHDVFHVAEGMIIKSLRKRILSRLGPGH